MDPNPSNFPILSYIMAKLPSIGPNRSSTDGVDIEQPPLPPPQPQEPHFDLTERMPRLTDPNVVSAMQLAVSEVAQTRSVLKTLGIRPDHEIVDIAKMKLAEINAKLSKHHDEDESVSSPPGSPDEWRKVAEKEREEYKSLISLDELHEAYEKMLKEAEEKLERIYEAAVAGGDVATAENVIDEKGSGVEEEVNEEVVMILKEALWKDVEKVDLSRRMLKFLPEAFGKIRSLIVLNLSTNQLRVIPDSIAGLENVEELHLSSNLLESLPDSIGLLVRLKILDVSGNKLTALPDSISNCRSLVELDASFNELTYLPTNIGYELVNVKRLSVPFNKLRSVPNSIGAMKSMRVLRLHFNQLHGLPRSIGNLTDLETLNLSSNFSDLTQLPDTISDLTNLKELDLSNNQIHELPDTFGRLDNLSKLNLDQNPLVIPPKEVVDGGAKAVKAFMIKRQLDIQKAEERQRMEDEEEQTLTSLLTRSTSWLTSAVSSVSGTVAEYLGGERKLEPNHYLNQQF